MTDTTRNLIQRLADYLEEVIEELVIPEYAHTEEERTDAALFLVKEAHAYLDKSEPEYPSDKELMELMPETMRDEFSCIAKLYSDATGGQVEPGIFRAALNTAVLEYAQAVLARYAS